MNTLTTNIHNKVIKSCFFLIIGFITNVSVIIAQETAFFAIGSGKSTEIKDQGEINADWVYATISFIESEAIRKGKSEFDLSEMFILYHNYMKKMKWLLNLNSKMCLNEYGQPQDVLKIMSEYGVVPEESFTGNNYGTVHNHTEMLKKINDLLNIYSTEQKQISDSILIKTTKILEEYLGQIPSKFKYKNKGYTPQGFMQKALDINPDDYIELTSYSHKRFYSLIDFEKSENGTHSEYLNFPIYGVIMAMNIALINGYTMVWTGDVNQPGYLSDDYFDNALAVLTWNDKKALNIMSMQEYRQKNFHENTAIQHHSLHIVGFEFNQSFDEVYYLAKDSYGKKGKSNGYILLSEDYIKLNTHSIMFHKDIIKLTHYLDVINGY